MNAASAPLQPVRPWWHGALALAAVALILSAAAISGAIAVVVFEALTRAGEAGPRGPDWQRAAFAGQTGAALAAFQAVTFLVTLFAAAIATRGVPSKLLAFRLTRRSAGIAAAPALGAILAASIYALIIFRLDRVAISNDMRPLAEQLHSSLGWWPALAAVVGAPVAEECLFRGFLFGIVRETRAGFRGAGLLTTAVWAALHAQYSLYGLVLIVGMGAVLAALRERTGGLAAPMIVHSAYNLAIVLAIALLPESLWAL